MYDAISVYQIADARFDIPLIKADLALAYHAAQFHDDLASQLASEALKHDPELPAALTVLAEQALAQHQAEQAVKYTQRMVDNDVFGVTAWLLHGDALLSLGSKALAKQAYQRAIELLTRTHQVGAAPQRLEEVKTALAAGSLPMDRFQRGALPATQNGQRSFPRDRSYPAAPRSPPPPKEPSFPSDHSVDMGY